MNETIPPEWDLTIPAEIEARFEGRWIAWDVTTRQVLTDGAVMADVLPGARPAQAAGHLVWFHYVLPNNVEMLGGQ